jgi:hypothetical protein
LPTQVLNGTLRFARRRRRRRQKASQALMEQINRALHQADTPALPDQAWRKPEDRLMIEVVAPPRRMVLSKPARTTLVRRRGRSPWSSQALWPGRGWLDRQRVTHVFSVSD